MKVLKLIQSTNRKMNLILRIFIPCNSENDYKIPQPREKLENEILSETDDEISALTIELNHANSTNDKIQIASLVSIFKL